jgi:RNA polymerase sporulation-specific sigma factor
MTDRAAFIEANLGLVHSCAKRFRGRGIEYDDLYQAGCVGLIKAYDAFDPGRGVKFSTYAVPVILGEIKRIFRDGGTVKVGRTLKERSVRVARENALLRERLQREPTITELAESLQMEVAEVAEAIGASVPPVSLTIFDDDGDSQWNIPVDSHEEKITELLSLRQAMCELAPKDRALLILRFFKSRTQVQTAAELGMTQVQVSRREKAILKGMREKLTG